LIFSTKPVLVFRGIGGRIIDLTMEMADVLNLADCEKKGRKFLPRNMQDFIDEHEVGRIGEREMFYIDV
jgi:hypothetical protein